MSISALARGGHLVVLRLDLEAHQRHHADHLVAQVVQGVGGRHREVPLLVTRLVPEVRLLVAPGVPRAFLGVDEVVAVVGSRGIADVVEDEELRLGAEERRVGDPGGLEVRLGLPRDVARVAGVALLRDRVDDVADQRQGRPGDERVHDGRVGVGDDQHVGGVDRLPAADGRPVETEPVLEAVLAEVVQGNGEVLPGPDEIHELQVHHLDFVFLGERQHFLRGHCGPSWGNGEIFMRPDPVRWRPGRVLPCGCG